MKLYDIWKRAWSAPDIEAWERPAYSTWVYKRFTAFLDSIGEKHQPRSIHGIVELTEHEWRGFMRLKHEDAFLAWVEKNPGTGPS